LKVATQRAIDRLAGSVICRILSWLSSSRQRQSPPVRRILIVLLSEMGSLTMTWPMISRLRQKYPEATLNILTFRRNVEIINIIGLTEPENIRAIDDQSLWTLMADSFKIMGQLRRQRPDVAIDCELFSRISAIFSWFSGAPARVGFYRYTQEGLYRGDFINRPVLYNPYLHISRQFINLVEAVDGSDVPNCKQPVSDQAPVMPEIMITEAEKQAVSNRLQERFPHFTMGQRPLVVLHPGGGLLPIRAWPPAYYRNIAAALTKAGYAIVVTGPPEDSGLAREIAAVCLPGTFMNLTGFTRTLRELLVVFSLSCLLITNDGGPGHFAGLVSLPSIILYGPETPVLYGALNRKAVNFFAGWACSPCLTAYNHRNSPCDGNNRCLQAIKPETVLDQALTMLAEGSAGSPAAVSGIET